MMEADRSVASLGPCELVWPAATSRRRVRAVNQLNSQPAQLTEIQSSFLSNPAIQPHFQRWDTARLAGSRSSRPLGAMNPSLRLVCRPSCRSFR